MKAWDSDVEEEDKGAETETTDGSAGTVGGVGKGDGENTQRRLQKVQKLIYAAKVFGLLIALLLVSKSADSVFQQSVELKGHVHIIYFIICLYTGRNTHLSVVSLAERRPQVSRRRQGPNICEAE